MAGVHPVGVGPAGRAAAAGVDPLAGQELFHGQRGGAGPVGRAAGVAGRAAVVPAASPWIPHRSRHLLVHRSCARSRCSRPSPVRRIRHRSCTPRDRPTIRAEHRRSRRLAVAVERFVRASGDVQTSGEVDVRCVPSAR